MSKATVPIIVAIIGALAAVIAARVGKKVGGEEEASKLRYTVYVIDAIENTGVPSASIAFNAEALVLNDATDSVGKHTFALDNGLSGKLAVVRVGKPGYKSSELQNTLPVREGTLTFRLEKAIAATPKPVPAAPTRVTDQLSFDSVPKVSGSMKAFSNWYELCSTNFPAGSIVEAVSFNLSGDRTCGAWAECREKEKSNSRVCWEFRMQGHDEWQPPGQASSQGKLTVQISRPAS